MTLKKHSVYHKVRVKWGALHNFKCVDYFQVEYHQVGTFWHSRTWERPLFLRKMTLKTPKLWRHELTDSGGESLLPLWFVWNVCTTAQKRLQFLQHLSDTTTLTWTPAPNTLSKFKPPKIIRFIIKFSKFENQQKNSKVELFLRSGPTGRF